MYTLTWGSLFLFASLHDKVASDAWSTLYVIVGTLARCSHTRADPIGFVASLVDQRYDTLLATGSLGDPPWGVANAVCSASLQAVGLASRLSGDVETFAESVCEAANELPKDTAGLWIGNWVEGVAARALRRAESVGHLLALASTCACGHGLPHCAN